jgi:hypothetical protein
MTCFWFPGLQFEIFPSICFHGSFDNRVYGFVQVSSWRDFQKGGKKVKFVNDRVIRFRCFGQLWWNILHKKCYEAIQKVEVDSSYFAFVVQVKKGELRPPKLKTEDPNKSYVQRPVKKGWRWDFARETKYIRSNQRMNLARQLKYIIKLCPLRWGVIYHNDDLIVELQSSVSYPSLATHWKAWKGH